MSESMLENRKNTTVLRNESGQGLTEYIALLLLIAVITIGAVKAVGSTVKQKFQTARNRINQDISLQ